MTVNHRVAGSSPAWGASFCKQLPILPTYRKTNRCLSALICHVLSATIHPDLKLTLVAMSDRTGMSVSQVTDEVLYAGLVEMQQEK